ncbi:hypothetical protein pb186bvf_006801 [Paramecium bursaria]
MNNSSHYLIIFNLSLQNLNNDQQDEIIYRLQANLTDKNWIIYVAQLKIVIDKVYNILSINTIDPLHPYFILKIRKHLLKTFIKLVQLLLFGQHISNDIIYNTSFSDRICNSKQLSKHQNHQFQAKVTRMHYFFSHFMQCYIWVLFIPTLNDSFYKFSNGDHSTIINILSSNLIVFISCLGFIGQGFQRQNGQSNQAWNIFKSLLIELLVLNSFFAYQNSYVLTYILGLLIQIILLYETLKNNIFPLKITQSILAVIIATISVIFYLLLIKFEKLDQEFFFFYALLSLPIISKLGDPLSLWIRQDDLESLFNFTQYKESTCAGKVELFQYLQSHISKCDFQLCLCKRKNFTLMDSENNLDIGLINSFIIQQFKQNQRRYDLVSYLSFIHQYSNNPYLNYQQYLLIMKTNSNLSDFQQQALSILGQQIIQELKNLFHSSLGRTELIIIQALNILTTIKNDICKFLDDLIEAKKQMWLHFSDAKIVNYQQLQNEIDKINTKLVFCDKSISQIEKRINQELGQYCSDHSVFLLRLKILFFYLATNQVTKVRDLQVQVDHVIRNEQQIHPQIETEFFLKQQATQMIIIISKERQGSIIRFTNDFLDLKAHNNIHGFMPQFFKNFHSGILEKYQIYGPSQIEFFDTYVQRNQFIVQVKINVNLTFLPIGECKDVVGLVTMMQVNDTDNGGFLLVDDQFSVFGQSRLVKQLLQDHQVETNEKLNIFLMIPTLNHRIQAYHNKQLQDNEQKLRSQIQICESQDDHFNIFHGQLECFKSYQSKIKGSKPYSVDERLEVLQFYEQDNNVSDKMVSYKIRYSIIQRMFEYIDQEVIKQKLFYQVNLQFDDVKQRVDDDEIIIKHLDLTEKKTQQYRDLGTFYDIQNIDIEIEQSQSSVESNLSFRNTIDMFHNKINQNNLTPTLRANIIISLLFVCFHITIIITLVSFIQTKRDIQSECFDKLQYVSEYLDGHGRTMISSRHVIYRRDYNKFLQSTQTYNQGSTKFNVTGFDKISFGLYLYQISIKKKQSQLQQYQTDQVNISFIRINFQYTDIDIQLMTSQAQYFVTMSQVFYIAIKTYAATPAGYLAGNTDTYAQVLTRSILYLNFKKVAQLTLDDMERCRGDNSFQNNYINNLFTITLTVFYLILVAITSALIIINFIIQRSRKNILRIFNRITFIDAMEEIQKLDFIKYQLDQGQYLLADIFEHTFDEFRFLKTQTNIQKSSTTIRSNRSLQIESYLSYKIQIFTIIILFTICLVFMISFQIQFQNYSQELYPIVQAALKTLSIRLQFLNTLNDWDAFTCLKFYNAMITIYQSKNYSNSSFNLYTENIRHGYMLYYLMNINETELQENIISLQEEPFTQLIYNLNRNSQNNNEFDILLQQDICLLQQFKCDLNSSVFLGRQFTSLLQDNFKVGIINLYKQTTQVMLQNDFFSLTDPFKIVQLYESMEYSYEYFLYVLWGFDATTYQIKLFSDYFINLSIQSLSNLTGQSLIQVYVVGLISSITIIVILININIYTYHQYVLTRMSLKSLPYKAIFNKNIMILLKDIDNY